MAVEKKPAATHDEKLLAVASHASITLFFIGPLTLVIPLMIWLLEGNKEKPSKFVRFHSRQAFFYQLTVYITVVILLLIIWLLTLIWIGNLLWPFYVLLWILFIAYGVYGAWQVWQDRQFRYKYVADFVEAGEK